MEVGHVNLGTMNGAKFVDLIVIMHGFEIADQLAPTVHQPLAKDEHLVPAFVNWLLEFEEKKYTYLLPDDQRNAFLNKTENEEGVNEEDEIDWEMGLHMEPRRGEDELEEGSVVESVAKEEENRVKKRRRQEYETVVYAHCGGRWDFSII